MKLYNFIILLCFGGSVDATDSPNPSSGISFGFGARNFERDFDESTECTDESNEGDLVGVSGAVLRSGESGEVVRVGVAEDELRSGDPEGALISAESEESFLPRNSDGVECSLATVLVSVSSSSL